MEVFKSTNYSPIGTVGYGSSGLVWSAQHRKTGHKVAIKHLRLPFATKEISKKTIHEIKLMLHFSHENLISIYDIIELENSGDILIVMELMDTDLGKIISSKNNITSSHHQVFIYQILRGLKCLHSANVVHRDIKPQNCLVNRNCDLKLADFGSGIELGSQEKSDESTTLWYSPPEILMKTKRFTTSSDIWSVGCIFAELVSGRPLFKGYSKSEQLSLILDVIEGNIKDQYKNEKDNEQDNKSSKKTKKKLQDLVPRLSILGKDLLCRMLVFEEDKRITIEEALRHPYFEDLHDSEDEPISENIFKSPKLEQEQSPETYRRIILKDLQKFKKNE